MSATPNFTGTETQLTITTSGQHGLFLVNNTVPNQRVSINLDLINTPTFAAGRRAGHELVKDVKVVSPTEITWRLEHPYAPYPSILSWTFLVPKHILEKASDPNTTPDFLAHPIGTGRRLDNERREARLRSFLEVAQIFFREF